MCVCCEYVQIISDVLPLFMNNVEIVLILVSAISKRSIVTFFIIGSNHKGIHVGGLQKIQGGGCDKFNSHFGGCVAEIASGGRGLEF